MHRTGSLEYKQMSTLKPTPTVREVDYPALQPAAQPGPPLSAELPFIPSLKVRAQLVLGHAELTIAQLRALKKEEVLELDRPLGDWVDLVVDDHVVARGTLVAVGEHFGLRVLETPHG